MSGVPIGGVLKGVPIGVPLGGVLKGVPIGVPLGGLLKGVAVVAVVAVGMGMLVDVLTNKRRRLPTKGGLFWFTERLI